MSDGRSVFLDRDVRLSLGHGPDAAPSALCFCELLVSLVERDIGYIVLDDARIHLVKPLGQRIRGQGQRQAGNLELNHPAA